MANSNYNEDQCNKETAFPDNFEFIKLLSTIAERIFGLRTDNQEDWTQIHRASFDGNVEQVKHLLEEHENIEACDKNKCKPIHLACFGGHLEIVKLLIEKKCSMEVCDEMDWTPIHYACLNGQTEVLKLLLNNQCDVTAKDKNGWRPIHVAMCGGHIQTQRSFNTIFNMFTTNELFNQNSQSNRSNHLEVVKLLIDRKSNIEISNINKWRPIHLACFYGEVEILNFLLEKNCNIEACDKNGNRPIHIAVVNGNQKIIKLLVDKGCNIEANDKFGFRPIHYACFFQQAEAVKILLDKNCNFEVKDEEGCRPIHDACRNGYTDIVKLLIEKNCDIEVEDKYKARPIHYACQGGHLNIIKVLLEKNCNFQACDKDNCAPIHEACLYGHINAVKLLIENNCDINVCTAKGNQPIHYACIKGHTEIVKLLINKHCKIKNSWALIHSINETNDMRMAMLLLDTVCNTEEPNNNNVLPIHGACYEGHLEFVELLVKRKCNIEARDPNGLRPIHAACFRGYFEISKFLLRNNCDIHASAANGFQPIHYACQGGHLLIVKLLIENHCNIEACAADDIRPIHLACSLGYEDIVKLLVENNCNTDAFARTNWRPIDLARKNKHFEVVDFLLVNDQRRQTNNEASSQQESVAAKNILENEIIKKMNAEIASYLELASDIWCEHRFCLNCLDLSKFEKKEIGKGIYGVVTKIKELQTEREIAVKEINFENLRCDKRSRSKMVEENINMYREFIHHDRIVKFYGAIEIANICFIFMEYVNNGSLDKLISDRDPIPHEKIIIWSKQIFEALEFLHRNKVIHRDIKPENILLDKENNAKLADLGLSRSIFDVPGPFNGNCMLEVTTANYTPHYMAPEILNGEQYSFPADIWSMGATVVAMLSGHLPYYKLKNETEVIRKIKTDRVIDFNSCLPMSEDMETFVDKMLRAYPSDRSEAFYLLMFLSTIL